MTMADFPKPDFPKPDRKERKYILKVLRVLHDEIYTIQLKIDQLKWLKSELAKMIEKESNNQ